MNKYRILILNATDPYKTAGYGSIIGAGATIIERVNIGEGSLIGAGSVVIKDVEPFNLVVGSPAKLVKRRSFYDMYLKK